MGPAMVFLSIFLYIQNGNDLLEDLLNFVYKAKCESNCFKTSLFFLLFLAIFLNYV